MDPVYTFITIYNEIYDCCARNIMRVILNQSDRSNLMLEILSKKEYILAMTDKNQ